MKSGVICNNFNHGRMVVSIQYCPTCGQKFNLKTDHYVCGDKSHAEKRKRQEKFCCDCGIDLLKKTRL